MVTHKKQYHFGLTKESACSCEVCGKTFKTKKNLYCHVLVHYPEKWRFKCDICGLKCMTNRIVSIHKVNQRRIGFSKDFLINSAMLFFHFRPRNILFWSRVPSATNPSPPTPTSTPTPRSSTDSTPGLTGRLLRRQSSPASSADSRSSPGPTSEHT